MTEGKKYLNPKKDFMVHPDAQIFIQNYQPKQKFGPEIAKIREDMEGAGLDYHNTDHDEEMLETARINTDNAICEGWRFPRVRRRK